MSIVADGPEPDVRDRVGPSPSSWIGRSRQACAALLSGWTRTRVVHLVVLEPVVVHATTVRRTTRCGEPDRRDDPRVLYIGPVEIPGGDDHEGYVSGVSPDGARSDIWTDARRIPHPTAYAAACECGWRGSAVHPAGPDGYRAAQRSWIEEHFALLAEARPVLDGLGRPLSADADFLTA